MSILRLEAVSSGSTESCQSITISGDQFGSILVIESYLYCCILCKVLQVQQHIPFGWPELIQVHWRQEVYKLIYTNRWCFPPDLVIEPRCLRINNLVKKVPASGTHHPKSRGEILALLILKAKQPPISVRPDIPYEIPGFFESYGTYHHSISHFPGPFCIWQLLICPGLICH